MHMYSTEVLSWLVVNQLGDNLATYQVTYFHLTCSAIWISFEVSCSVLEILAYWSNSTLLVMLWSAKNTFEKLNSNISRNVSRNYDPVTYNNPKTCADSCKKDFHSDLHSITRQKENCLDTGLHDAWNVKTLYLHSYSIFTKPSNLRTHTHTQYCQIVLNKIFFFFFNLLNRQIKT